METEDKTSESIVRDPHSASEISRNNQSVQITDQETLAESEPKSGGPRTQQGKQNSRSNSLKHGIFSKVVVAKGESKEEFAHLLRELRTDRKPVGALEELLVDKIATWVWRHRRLVQELREQAKVGKDPLALSCVAPSVDLFIRYEVTIDRGFDRALLQLERLQRARKGLPELPTLNVNVSS